MTVRQATRPSFRLPSVALLLVLGACTSVLGIEDLHEGPRPGSGGDDSSAGSSNPSGGKSTAGGKTGNGGSPNPGGGETNPEGGAGNAPAAGAGGEAGVGGAAQPVDGAVHGKVIDLWGGALANVPIQIGDELGSTNAEGEFTFDNVPSSYDVSLTISGGNPNRDYGWVYQGLTRRDPTLQVYSARQEYETTVVVKTINVGTSPFDTVTAAFGTPTGQVEDKEVDFTYAPGEGVNVPWLGATSSTGTAHALLWSTVSGTNKAPAKYKAYVSKPVGLMDGTDDELTFDLTPGTLDAGNISGTITGGTGERVNKLYARFESNANIQLMAQASAPNTFSYLVPTLPKASISIAAIAGDDYGPIGVAHADGLAKGDSSIKLTIPSPATPVKPKGIGSKLGADKVFAFTPAAGNDGPFVVFIERRDRSYFSMYVVTAQKELKLPTVLGGAFSLLPGDGEQGAEYAWGIETHGDYGSVDDMTGPTGFIDSFGDSWGAEPRGPRQGDGSFTFSGSYPFGIDP
ncbi:MAG TPA: hypothetical protein VHP33_16810 [Polyangiaceae bacterium]|nr:hypothetical protein [Polyangiaceae bacterium]